MGRLKVLTVLAVLCALAFAAAPALARGGKDGGLEIGRTDIGGNVKSWAGREAGFG